MERAKILKDLPWEEMSQQVDNWAETPHVKMVMASIGSALAVVGVPETHHPDAEQLLLFSGAVFFTLFSYWYWFGHRHRRRRKDLEKRLKQAQSIVADLEEKLQSIESLDLDLEEDGSGRKEIRVWMDGAFDMMHYGHMNAFRLGRALGTKLIVGVNSDETITQCKGSPVMNDEERIACVRGCKFVDEVVGGVPYIMNDAYIKHIIETYNIDYIVHGDDPCIVDGKDVYEAAQKIGKYLTIPRTEGISTTDIVGRMLLMTRSHHKNAMQLGEGGNLAMSGDVPKPNEEMKSQFLTTSRVIRLFGAGVKAPPKGCKIVYLAGSWDMFHSGHNSILEKARKFGDYVIVGVHRDSEVNKHRGVNLPIMTLHERVLSVLGCKYVDDVLIDAPYEISQEMINGLNIGVVVHGNVLPEDEQDGSADPYALPRKLKMVKVVDSGSDLTVFDIEDRIFKQRERFEVKFAKKKAAEDEYYSNKYSAAAESTEEDEAPAKAEKSSKVAKSSVTPAKTAATKTAAGKKAAASKKGKKKAVEVEEDEEEEASEEVELSKAGRPKRNAAKKFD